MRFTVHKRRSPPAVIIVALIDILVVLLIFLMVTTTFKQQPNVKLALPESSQAVKSGASETPPLVVTIAADGSLFLEKLPVTPERLQNELASRAAANPQVEVILHADKTAPFGDIAKLLDSAKAAGIKKIGYAVTKNPARQ